MRRWKWSLLLLLLLAMATSAAARAADDGPGPSSSDAALAQLLALPPALREQWHAALAASRTPDERLQRLVRFVTTSDAPDALGIRYREDADHGLAEVHATREANCLGFTLLFVALAREAGLAAGAQEIRRTLSWTRQGDTLYRSGHLNAWVRVGARRYVLDAVPQPPLGGGAAGRISDARLLAHAHNNRAMAQLARGELDAALSNMERALAIDPGHASHWSNSGVLRLRLGDEGGAERAYREALRREPDNLEALFNSASLAQRRGDARSASFFRGRLEHAQQRDPFHQFLLALDYERAGDLPRAIEHYRRATRLRRDEPRFHLALAQAYRRAGDATHAARAAARAQALARPR